MTIAIILTVEIAVIATVIITFGKWHKKHLQRKLEQYKKDLYK